MSKLTNARCLSGRLLFCLIFALLPALTADAAGPATTTVADTVYRADGTPAAGTLVISWPAFTTADGKAVPAGRKTVKIGAAGAVSIPLVPNYGASPEGTYYKVTYKLDDGATSDEYWSLPAAPTTTISAIRSKLVPANVAVQYATRQYVDSMLAQGGGASGNAVEIQGKDIDTTEPARGQSLVFDGTKYVPQSHAIVDVVRDCGAKGDGVTDDGPAIQACIDANMGKTILFPQTRPPGSCSYRIAIPAGSSGNDKFGLIMNGHGQQLTGDTHGMGVGTVGNGVTLCFAAGLTGILLPNTNVIAGVPASNGGCQGCAVENLMLRGSEPYAAADPTTAILPGVGDTSVNYGSSTGASQADGIRCAASFCTIRDVGIQNFGRHGIYLDGNSGPAGNFADSASVTNVYAQFNRGSGLFNRGSDSNASVVSGLQCVGNQLWCVENYSFLGSAFVGGTAHSQHVDNMAGHTQSFSIAGIANSGNVTTVTTATNHNFAVGMAAVISGTTNYDGTWFVASVPAAKQFTFVQGSPLGSESVGTVSDATATQMWTKAGGDAIGGCFRSTGGAVTSVFVNPYCESDNNGRNKINSATNLIIGGDIGNEFDWAANPPNWITTTVSGMVLTPAVFQGRSSSGALQDVATYIGGNPSNNVNAADNQVLNLINNNPFAVPGGSKGHLEFRLTRSSDGTGVWGWRCCSGSDLNGLTNYAMYMEYGASTDSANANPKAGFPNGFWHGYTGVNTSKLWFGNINAVANLPTWFEQPVGSIAINNGAAAGGFAGWIATSSGSPGTYRAFGPIANDATGTSWTVPTLNVTTLNVASTTPVANLTLASDSQLPTISTPGKIAAAAITGIQGRNVASSAPNDGDCYKWSAGASQWQPSSCSGGGGGSTLLNYQKSQVGIPGDGTEKTVYTYTLPGGTMTSGSCVRVTWMWNKTGSNGASWKLYYGASSLALFGGGAGTAALSASNAMICNDPGATNSQQMMGTYGVTGTTPRPPGFGTAGEDSTADKIIRVTMTVAAPDVITPQSFLVEKVQ